ncbi:MAG TPA: hypothetical protein VF904_07755 [Anaeromyxobacteraceae bacterium]
MIAYKFLSPGAVAPFTGFHWPVPGPSGAGAWVEAPDELPLHGIHACRVADLAFWLDTELWRTELADPVVDAQRQIVGSRGRLLERISGWDEGMARTFAEACAWRARDRAVAALRGSALDAEADLLAGTSGISRLRSVSHALAAHGGLPAALAGYLAETIDFLLAGDSACSAYISARSAVVAEGGQESAFGAEREEQSSLLAGRLGL